MKSWLERRVQPLADRAHPMYLYKGQQNRTWAAPGELNEDEQQARIHALTNLGMDKISITVAMEPFSPSHPPSDISFLSQGRVAGFSFIAIRSLFSSDLMIRAGVRGLYHLFVLTSATQENLEHGHGGVIEAGVGEEDDHGSPHPSSQKWKDAASPKEENNDEGDSKEEEDKDLMIAIPPKGRAALPVWRMRTWPFL